MSPRPKLNRQLKEPPSVTGFVPINGDYNLAEKVILLFEEYESIRLMDYENLTQLEASNKLNVSRPTLTRIYDSARKKVAKAFVENKPISIEGGDVSFNEFWYYCNSCYSSYKTVKQISIDEISCPVCNSRDVSFIQDSGDWPYHKVGKNFNYGKKQGIEGNCICPKCDLKIAHEAGIPCSSKLCPKCSIRMIRENTEHHKVIIKKRKLI